MRESEGDRQTMEINKDKKAAGSTNDKPPTFKSGKTSLLQIGVVFLAVVSFFTTANGMNEYIFIDNGVIAYCASAAIQCMLLALSMNLPGYLSGIWRWKSNVFLRICVCALSLLLTGVILFCSSWFSYVYIADIIHQDSWGVDSELLVQQTYRSELYDARDYARIYRIYLEESVGEKILLLETQARQLSKEDLNSNEDWEREWDTYVSNNGATAASYMSTVIEAMSNALQSNSSQENQNLAVIAVADAKRNIAERMDSIQENLDTLNNNLINYNERIADLTRRINNATEDTDTAALSESINRYTQLISQITQQQLDLQTESMQLDNALLRLSYYESLLGLTSSTSLNFIRNALMEMQAEFFQQEPDLERLRGIATSIFESLRNVSNSSFEEGDELAYTNLLIQMNQLIRNLTDHSEIKSIETDLEKFISELRESDMVNEPESDNTSSTSTDEEGESNEADEPESDNMPSAPADTEGEDDGAEEPESGDIPSMPADAEGEDDGANEPESGNMLSAPDGIENTGDESDKSEQNNVPSAPEDADNVQWRDVWGERLQKLKARISALPMYSASEEQADKVTSVLSESQIAILRNYDRNKSNQNLDDMVRRYIARRSAIYEGIIYLQSPYRSLALFALVLAFSFDISGFIFGLVIQGESTQPKKDPNVPDGIFGKNRSAEWGIVETQNQYMVLTGDFNCKDGTYYYKVFKDGLPEQWVVQDDNPYIGDIYIRNREDPARGEMVERKEQELLFSEQPNGPADGIYTECQLFFDEGGLILVQQDKRRFLASINEYVPIHSFNKERGENRTIPAKDIAVKGINAQIAIVALNVRGTRVSAIYIIEQ